MGAAFVAVAADGCHLAEGDVVAYDSAGVDNNAEAVLERQAVAYARARGYHYAVAFFVAAQHEACQRIHPALVLRQPEPEAEAHAGAAEAAEPDAQEAVAPTVMPEVVGADELAAVGIRLGPGYGDVLTGYAVGFEFH